MYCYLWVDDEVRHPSAGDGIVVVNENAFS